MTLAKAVSVSGWTGTAVGSLVLIGINPFEALRAHTSCGPMACWRKPMELRSSRFRNETTIPRRFSCDGEDLSPPLEWGGAPAGIRNFVLLCDDPDAPAGTWRHWAAYDIPADQTEPAEDAARHAAGKSFEQAISDFRKSGYGGPCPPHLHGIHYYHFRLLALSANGLPLGSRPSCQEVEREARKHAIAEAALIGLYQR